MTTWERRPALAGDRTAQPLADIDEFCGRIKAGKDSQSDDDFAYVFVPEKAERFFAFAQKLKHYKGEWAGKPIVLEAWEKFVLGGLFGWKRADGTRRFRSLYLEVAKKNGKTLLAAGLGLLLAFFDGEPGAEVYSLATKEAQAKLTAERAEHAAQIAAAKAKAEAEIKAKQDEAKKAEADRAKDLEDRRRKALAEAEAIRAMMSAPKKVLVAKKPEEPKPAAVPAVAKGTLSKPAAGAAKPGQAPAAAPAAGAGKKEVKSENLSSTWKDDANKKKEIKTRGDTGAGQIGRAHV